VSTRVVVVVLLAGTLLAACGTTPAPPPDGTGYPAIASSVALSALACEPLAWCVAAGTNPAVSTGAASIEVSAGGRGRWAPVATPALPGATLTAAGCWTSGCLIGGADPSGSLVVIVNPARKVASATASHPPGSGIAAIACTTPGRCLAFVTATTDTAVFETTTSGAAWAQRSTLPAGLAVATAASCATPSDCVAVGTAAGGAAAAARSVDGAVRWRLSVVPRGLQTFTSVTCGSARWCLATARRPNGTAILLKSTDGGATWAEMATTLQGPAAAACTNVPTCVVAGGGSGGGEIAVDVRTPHVRSLTLAYVPDPIVAAACATPVKCAAITPASTVSFVG
jgi:hypothetical protein